MIVRLSLSNVPCEAATRWARSRSITQGCIILIEPYIPPNHVPEPLRVCRLDERDAGSIAEFFRAAAWDHNATVEGVREMFRTAADTNPFEPGTGPPLVGVYLGTRLVGFVSSIPTQFWNGKESSNAHWLKGYWVLEEHRNSPIGFLLLKEMLKQVDLVASMPASLMARRMSEALGMRDLGAVRDYIEPLRPVRIVRKLDPKRFEHLKGLPRAASTVIRAAKIPPFAWAVGALVSLVLAVLRLPAALAGRGLTTQLGERLPGETALDSLWARARTAVTSSATRSGAYLRWRYQRSDSGRYRFASVWRGDSLLALAVLAQPQRSDDARLAGLGIGSVVDLVLDPACPGALTSLLRVARRWARSANYDALLLSASHRALRAPLLREGYIPMPGNIHLLLRDPRGKYGMSTDLDAWMLTRGDAWGDHL